MKFELRLNSFVFPRRRTVSLRRRNLKGADKGSTVPAALR